MNSPFSTIKEFLSVSEETSIQGFESNHQAMLRLHQI